MNPYLNAIADDKKRKAVEIFNHQRQARSSKLTSEHYAISCDWKSSLCHS